MNFENSTDTEIKCSKAEILNIVEKGNFIEVPEKEVLGWDEGDDRTTFAQRAIKRFRLKKLKSQNDTYYLDNVYYYIWKYEKDLETGEERLLKPDEATCDHLRELNTIIFKPFHVQPQEFW
jgi:hypothetical protein